jgi:hypothetical protein
VPRLKKAWERWEACLQDMEQEEGAQELAKQLVKEEEDTTREKGGGEGGEEEGGGEEGGGGAEGVTLTLAEDYLTAKTHERTWRRDFARDVCAALRCNPSRFQYVGMRSGSILASFNLLPVAPGDTDKRNARNLASELVLQVPDVCSPLRCYKLLQIATSSQKSVLLYSGLVLYSRPLLLYSRSLLLYSKTLQTMYNCIALQVYDISVLFRTSPTSYKSKKTYYKAKATYN